MGNGGYVLNKKVEVEGDDLCKEAIDGIYLK
jgi:hypothetical protein